MRVLGFGVRVKQMSPLRRYQTWSSFYIVGVTKDRYTCTGFPLVSLAVYDVMTQLPGEKCSRPPWLSTVQVALAVRADTYVSTHRLPVSRQKESHELSELTVRSSVLVYCSTGTRTSATFVCTQNRTTSYRRHTCGFVLVCLSCLTSSVRHVLFDS